jgi:hypothetical protein
MFYVYKSIISDLRHDKAIFPQALSALVTLDDVSLGLGRFWISCVDPFVLLLPKLYN